MPKSLIGQRNLLVQIDHGRTWVFEGIRNGTFPKPIRIGSRLFWDSEVIDAWILAQLTSQSQEVPAPVVVPSVALAAEQLQVSASATTHESAPINSLLNPAGSLDENHLEDESRQASSCVEIRSVNRRDENKDMQNLHRKLDADRTSSVGQKKLPSNVVRCGKSVDVFSLCGDQANRKTVTKNSLPANKSL